MQDNSPHRHAADRCPHCGHVERPTWRERLGRNARSLGLVTVLVVFAVLALAARGLPDYWRNFTQNTAADLAGGALFAYVIGPLSRWQSRVWRRDAPPDPEPPPTVEPPQPVERWPLIPSPRPPMPSSLRTTLGRVPAGVDKVVARLRGIDTQRRVARPRR